METTNLTIGDVLPDNMKSKYSEKVLKVPLVEAVQIGVYKKPPKSKLDKKDINSIIQIFDEYKAKGGPSSSGGSSYWSKTPEENKTYWEKK